MTHRIFTTLTVIALLAGTAVRASDAPDVRELMTPEEFEAAGLARQSPEEMKALNAWLLRYTAHDAPLVRQTNKEVKREIRSPPPEVIRDRLEGEFLGWDGKTIFRLKNGQVWQQRMDDTYRFRSLEPEVEIYRSFMGRYRMKVIETGKSVPVSRLQ